MAPPTWRDRAYEMQLENTPTSGYTLITSPIAFNGNYHLFFFPRLGRLLDEHRPDILHIDEEPYNLATFLAVAAAPAASGSTRTSFSPGRTSSATILPHLAGWSATSIVPRRGRSPAPTPPRVCCFQRGTRARSASSRNSGSTHRSTVPWSHRHNRSRSDLQAGWSPKREWYSLWTRAPNWIRLSAVNCRGWPSRS